MKTFDSEPANLREPHFTATLAHDVVRVVDYDDGNRSVTNAAESVVDEIVGRWPEVRARRIPIIIYRDSMGRWDQLLHGTGGFLGFRNIGASCENEAVDKVLKGL